MSHANTDNYKPILNQLFNDCLKKENEPCGGSYNFDAWWDGCFDTLETMFPSYTAHLRDLKRRYNKGDSIHV